MWGHHILIGIYWLVLSCRKHKRNVSLSWLTLLAPLGITVTSQFRIWVILYFLTEICYSNFTEFNSRRSVWSTRHQHRSKRWIGTEQATSLYLKQSWPSLWHRMASLIPNELTRWGLVTPFGDIDIWVNTDSGNGLMPNGTKPLPEPMLTGHQ